MRVKAGTNLCNEDAPEEGPDDVSKVQQHHVFEEQRWQSKLGNKVSQPFRLVLSDQICPLGQIHPNFIRL